MVYRGETEGGGVLWRDRGHRSHERAPMSLVGSPERLYCTGQPDLLECVHVLGPWLCNCDDSARDSVETQVQVTYVKSIDCGWTAYHAQAEHLHW